VPEEDDIKPQETPVPTPQNDIVKPTTIIPQTPISDLTDYQTEGIKPDFEKKNKD
jgi:hypothetical protein